MLSKAIAEGEMSLREVVGPSGILAKKYVKRNE